MSLTGMMRTSVSGMAAQANRLGTVSDNIANSSTNGYKRASTEFSTMVLASGVADYTPGGVQTQVRYAISEQGAFEYTTSTTDLAVKGQGFYIVSNANGTPYLTRAGSFVPDGDGNLVNAAGYQLMGYSLATGSPPVVANGYAGLEVVNIASLGLQANASTSGNLFVNLSSNATAVAAGNLPSLNGAGTQYTSKTSLLAYGNLGDEVTLDVYMTKTSANTWEVSVFDRAAAASGGGFPYTSGPLTTSTLTFDP